jgi:hypothetical protein
MYAFVLGAGVQLALRTYSNGMRLGRSLCVVPARPTRE